jgi:hypothetical protein
MRLLLEISLILLSPALTLAYTGKSVCFVGANKRVGTARRSDSSSTRVLARGDPKSTGPGFSYVDGDNFENAEDEILAMGGDPFFLGLEDDSKEDNAPPPPIESKTNLPLDPEADTTEPKKFEWDGEVDDEAHLDLY